MQIPSVLMYHMCSEHCSLAQNGKISIIWLTWGADVPFQMHLKIGFDSDFNEVSIFYKDNKFDKLSYKPKSEISDEIVEKIINDLN